MSKVVVALFNTRAAAEVLRRRLEEAGIPAEIRNAKWFQKLWFVPKNAGGVHLIVPATQFESAERLLLAWDVAEGALRQVIRCPECRSLRVQYPQAAKHSVLPNVVMGLSTTVGLVEKEFYCEDCHFTWPKEGELPRRNRPNLAPYYFLEGIEQTTLAHPDDSRKAA